MKHSLTLEYEEVQESALSPDDQQLLSDARSATQQAYAPYSQFQVGAALRLTSGAVVKGSNKENASFPAGICAERNALNYAHDHHPGDPVEAIAIAARSGAFDLDEVLSPCGICRQVMAETEQVQGKDVIVLLEGPNGMVRKFYRAADLLPFHFYLNALKK